VITKNDSELDNSFISTGPANLVLSNNWYSDVPNTTVRPFGFCEKLNGKDIRYVASANSLAASVGIDLNLLSSASLNKALVERHSLLKNGTSLVLYEMSLRFNKERSCHWLTIAKE